MRAGSGYIGADWRIIYTFVFALPLASTGVHQLRVHGTWYIMKGVI